jgi:tetratricopeptide (TPR) repeat protein
MKWLIMTNDQYDYEDNYNQAIKLLNDGNYEKANKKFEELKDRSKEFPNANRGFGRLYRKEGDEKDAEAKLAPYKKDRELFKNEASTNYKEAKKEFTSAIEKVKSGINFKHLLIEVSPEIELAWTYHDLAYILKKEKQYLASEENYKESIKVLEGMSKAIIDGNKDKYPISWFLNDLGHLYFEWGKYDEAIEQYNKVIEEDKKNGYAQVFRGLAFFQKGNLTKANEDFKAALIEFDDRIAKMKIHKDHIKKPLKDLRESSDKFIKTPSSSTEERKSKFKTFKDAFETFKDAFEKEGGKAEELKEFENTTKLDGGSEQSLKLDDLKNEMNALESKFSTDQLKLEKASILTNIGRLELEKGNYENASKRFKDSKDIYDDVKTYLNQLQNKSVKCKEFDNISALHNNLGILHYKQDHLDDAIKEFILALNYSDSARAYNNLGNAYYKKNDNASAIENYLMALELDPELKEAKKNLNSLKEAKEKSGNWWEWWFSGQSWIKKISGTILLVLFLLIVVSAFIPFENSIVKLNTNNSKEETTSTTIPLILNNPQITSVVNESVVTVVTTKTNITKKDSEITRTEQTTETPPTRTKTTKETSKEMEISPETKLLFAALILFALIHPQIKGFSAGSIKFDLEPIVASKGAASPQISG